MTCNDEKRRNARAFLIKYLRLNYIKQLMSQKPRAKPSQATTKPRKKYMSTPEDEKRIAESRKMLKETIDMLKSMPF